MTMKISFAVSLILTVVAGTALAAGSAIDLNLQGGYANKIIRACGSTNHYGFYQPRRRVDFKGTLAPAPASPRIVKVKIKKCVRGRFVRFKELHIRVNSRGSYQGSFTIGAKGYYFARTYDYAARPAAKSAKRHFRIR
jgi:hypothetical protein